MSKIPKTIYIVALLVEWFVKLIPFNTINATVLMGYLQNIFPF